MGGLGHEQSRGAVCLFVYPGLMPITTEPTPEDIPAVVGRVHFNFAFGSHAASCGHWLGSGTAGPPTPSDLSSLAATIGGFWAVPGIMGVLSDSLTLDNCKVVWSDGVGGAVEGESIIDAPGLVSGDAMPANTALVMSMHDGSHYRGGKGRFYIPGLPNVAAASVSSWSEDFLTTINAAFATYLTEVNALTTDWGGPLLCGTLHRWRAGVAITPDFRPTASIVGQARICTQRRRLGPTL